MSEHEGMWVRLECTFQCRTCAFRVPLNGIDVDGVVVCAHCGLEQAFDVNQWQGLLHGAHGSVDLARDRAAPFTSYLGMDYLELGKTRASRTVEGSDGENHIQGVVSLGAPACEKCGAPVQATLDTSAKPLFRTTTTCACGATATYETPPRVREMVNATMLIAHEHVVDKKQVKVDGSDAAIALRCPGCDAPLPAENATKFVTCAYCRLQSRIPDRAWFRVAKTMPAPDPTWIQFHGPSRLRQELLSRQKHDALEREKQAHVAERVAKEQAARRQEAQAQLDRDRARKKEEAQRVAREKADTAREAKNEKKFTILVSVGLGTLMAGVAVASVVSEMPNEVQKATKACTDGNNGKECDHEGALLAATKPHEAEKAYDRACGLAYGPGCIHAAAAEEATKNYGAALEDYVRACSDGLPEGCSSAEALVASTKVGGSTRVTYYENQCKLGKLDGCNSAGKLYATGADGLGQDPREAAQLYGRACNGGNAAGCKLLADACKAGNAAACPAHADAGAPKRR